MSMDRSIRIRAIAGWFEDECVGKENTAEFLRGIAQELERAATSSPAVGEWMLRCPECAAPLLAEVTPAASVRLRTPDQRSS